MSARGLLEFRADIERAGSVEAAVEGWLSALRMAAEEDPAIWISRFPDEAVRERARALDKSGPEGLPLWGLPFAVKDNLDVAGLPTTAACPAFAYLPSEDAPVVQLLLAAGAICLGKTNLDQFATGLVGTRSPYGVPKNALHADYIPGGSSSGSAVAVARGLVAFALGTDTAGSGRVPAAFNGITGWKPTRGLLSTRGLVPACRSLDCVSIFAARAGDCQAIAPVIAKFDPLDPWSRRAPTASNPVPNSPVRMAIPLPEDLEWFGDAESARCWEAAVASLEAAGHQIVPRSFRPFLQAAKLLYEGPWVAERYAVIRELLAKNPDAVFPVTREIIAGGSRPAAWEAFIAMDRLAELRRASEAIWEDADVLALPTTPTIYRLEEVLAEPLRLNSNLGTYTNFFNLLDLCGLAIPAGTRADGLPFGITLAAPAFADDFLLCLGSGKSMSGDSAAATSIPLREKVAVFGAHMRGLPLSARLLELGGEFVRNDRTAACYRMVALDALRPGVFRVAQGGGSLALEIWALPQTSLGALLAEIPAPLGLGRVELADGSKVIGFLCESCAAEGKPDLTSLGGWRNHLAQQLE